MHDPYSRCYSCLSAGLRHGRASIPIGGKFSRYKVLRGEFFSGLLRIKCQTSLTWSKKKESRRLPYVFSSGEYLCFLIMYIYKYIYFCVHFLILRTIELPMMIMWRGIYCCLSQNILFKNQRNCCQNIYFPILSREMNEYGKLFYDWIPPKSSIYLKNSIGFREVCALPS